MSNLKSHQKAFKDGESSCLGWACSLTKSCHRSRKCTAYGFLLLIIILIYLYISAHAPHKYSYLCIGPHKNVYAHLYSQVIKYYREKSYCLRSIKHSIYIDCSCMLPHRVAACRCGCSSSVRGIADASAAVVLLACADPSAIVVPELLTCGCSSSASGC